MVKLKELRFELLSHPPYSPNLAPGDYWPFAHLKRMLQGKRLGSNEEVIAEVEAYFESKDKSFNEKDIKKLEERWVECIHLKMSILKNKVQFCLKVVVLLVRPGIY
ncbi:histone-lysine N-methyltransferase SETMAR [Trichonephila clavipes]|nr:histone-lysine N-methyltransferase SETMAR [Trichonephila clavipes]